MCGSFKQFFPEEHLMCCPRSYVWKTFFNQDLAVIDRSALKLHIALRSSGYSIADALFPCCLRNTSRLRKGGIHDSLKLGKKWDEVLWRSILRCTPIHRWDMESFSFAYYHSRMSRQLPNVSFCGQSDTRRSAFCGKGRRVRSVRSAKI